MLLDIVGDADLLPFQSIAVRSQSLSVRFMSRETSSPRPVSNRAISSAGEPAVDPGEGMAGGALSTGVLVRIVFWMRSSRAASRSVSRASARRAPLVVGRGEAGVAERGRGREQLVDQLAEGVKHSESQTGCGTSAVSANCQIEPVDIAHGRRVCGVSWRIAEPRIRASPRNLVKLS